MPDRPYQKIVCLVPSLTELIVDLGLEDQLIGRTRFCIHPKDKVSPIEIVGGTKNPNIEKILDLKPDLVLANKEENRKLDIDKLRDHVEVQVTDISSVAEAIQAIHFMGEKLEVAEQAEKISSHISYLISEDLSVDPVKTAYFIWKDPWMTVGGDTYIHDVLDMYQLKNVFGHQTRYPETSLDELRSKSPELILLSSEPYPFKEKHVQEIKEACPEAMIELVNGEYFSWYGSRMIKAFSHLNNWRKAL